MLRARRPRLVPWLAICLPAAALIGCDGDPSRETEAAAAEPTPVKLVAVTQEPMSRTTTQPATVHPYYQAEIRARVSGYVEELKADIGDVVEADAPLAVIDTPQLQKQRAVSEARIVRLEAEEAQAAAGVELAAAGVRSAEAQREETASQVSGAKAMLAAAEAEFERTRELVERQSIERRVLDEVRERRDAAAAGRDAAQSAVASAEAAVAVARANRAVAEADARAAAAATLVARRQLEELEALLEFATLRAPFAGVVTERTVDPGDLVREGNEVGAGRPLFTVIRTDPVRVRVPVPEADAALVDRGDEMTLTFPSFPAAEPLTTTVTRRSGSLDPSTRTMLVEAEVPNPDGRLLPGMFGQATIVLSAEVAAGMLPARAVRYGEDGGAFVYVVGDDATVSVVPVTTGADDGNAIEVLSGVTPGQRVVDAHLTRFVDGDRVAPLPD